MEAEGEDDDELKSFQVNCKSTFSLFGQFS